MDDVLVFGSSRAEHDARLLVALKRIDDAGVTLNIEKCEFSRTSITFLGHRINQSGISADPEKTKAIRAMRAPTTVPELRRFMGMVNQLGKFTSNLVHLTQPLRPLLSKDTDRVWGPDQREAFTHVKDELSKPTTLALYDTEAPTKLSADASSYGLGAVLMEKTEGGWRPVAYARRSLTETERRYAQIEKEALAITWSCEKFSDSVLGKEIVIETDHKLVLLLTTKQLDSSGKSSPISPSDGSIYLHTPTCTWQGSTHSRCTISSTIEVNRKWQGPKTTGRTPCGGKHQLPSCWEGEARVVPVSSKDRPNLFDTAAVFGRTRRPSLRKSSHISKKGESSPLMICCCMGAVW